MGSVSKPNAVKASKPKKIGPTCCKQCGHDMGRSRCKVIDGLYSVRCNKCKTVHTITIKFPKDQGS